ncbi:MAG: D-alanine--D-alanine ligase [Syntrophaceae bacterium]|nr:D-alanine--D-alanine ligase [Syntrophaceae bacterium]
MMKKESVAVIFGGRSVEHEVSVITGHQVMDALSAAGYSLLPIYIAKGGEWYAGRALYQIRQYSDPSFRVEGLRDVHRVSLSPDRSIRQLLLHPDAKTGFLKKPPLLWADVFFPAVHGSMGEDGTLQGVFELADVPYVGSNVLASALGMDKVRMKAVFKDAGIPVIDCLPFSRGEWKSGRDAIASRAETFCGYPMMVKPVSLGSSIGIRRCSTPAELAEAIDVAFELDERVLVERALLNFIDVNCSVLGPPEEASVCEQPCRSEGILTFEDKYNQGGKGIKGGGIKGGMASQARLIPAPISPEMTARIQDLSRKAFRALGASGVARIDFLLDTSDQSLYLNEINTLPGALSFYLWEASGVPFDELVSRLIGMALERHRTRSETRFSFEANLLRAGGARKKP